jgi:iron complex outermembrane recepter protein
VTAQKRAESEQNVPLSMTTFSAASLEQKDINNFFDYATKVPNLAFAPTGDGMGTARTVAIRGVSGNNVTSFYIDLIPLVITPSLEDASFPANVAALRERR